MKNITNIVIFNFDGNTPDMLEGYCFAKNIKLTALDLTMPGIREMAEIQPDLVLVPSAALEHANNTLEMKSFRREISKYPQIEVCILQDEGAGPVLTKGLPIAADHIIQAPFDLEQFDKYINTAFACTAEMVERRYHERRSFTERRVSYYSRYCGSRESGFHIDQRSKCLYVNGNKVDLTPKEFELIEFLLTDVDRIFSVDEIVNHLWPTSQRATKSDLYQYMHLLRKKIEADPNNPKLLMNVKGYGYKLNIT